MIEIQSLKYSGMQMLALNSDEIEAIASYIELLIEIEINFRRNYNNN